MISWVACCIMYSSGACSGARADLDGLHQRADGLCVVALDKVLQLGQRHHHVAQFFGSDAACHDIGQFEGLVFQQL